MITLIHGENSFENEKLLKGIANDFLGESERLDGETLSLKQLPDLLTGMTFFESHRLVVIRNLSLNKALWNALEDWVEKVSGDTHVVLVEVKPDKRTKTYKLLQKAATIHESKLWAERDTFKAQQWVMDEAPGLGVVLDKESAQRLVERVGADQWALFRALEKLALVDEVTPVVIEDIIEPSEIESAFGLFESALRGNGEKVRQMLTVLQKDEDAYRLFGLLQGQVFQLAALSVADVSDREVASDFGVHPFAVSKLQPFSKKLGRKGAKEIVRIFAYADEILKSSAADPWLLIEQALLKTVKIAS